MVQNESSALCTLSPVLLSPFLVCFLLFLLSVAMMISVSLFQPHLYLILSLLARYLLPTCYHPDGTVIVDPSIKPCNQAVSTVSMCCSLNRGSYPDQCLFNGLRTSGGNIFRDSCTDPTWTSPGPLQLCRVGLGWSGSIDGNGRGLGTDADVDVET